MKKTIVSLITCILIATAIINPAQAANLEQAPITPLWDNISQAELILNFPSNYGEVSVAVSQQSGCDKIETCVTIYRYDRGTWVYIASKSKSVERNILTDVLTFDQLIDNAMYKAVMDVTVYRDGTSESYTKTTVGTYQKT